MATMRPSRSNPMRALGVVIARLGVGQERIGARRGPAHRPAQQLRGPGDGRDLDGKISLHAETAADVGRDDADFVLGDVQRVERQPAPQIMRLLGRGVERVTIGSPRRIRRDRRAAPADWRRAGCCAGRARRSWRRRPARFPFSRDCRARYRTRCWSRSAHAGAARRARSPRADRTRKATARNRPRPPRRHLPPRSGFPPPPPRRCRRRGAPCRRRKPAAAHCSSAGRRKTASDARR